MEVNIWHQCVALSVPDFLREWQAEGRWYLLGHNLEPIGSTRPSTRTGKTTIIEGLKQLIRFIGPDDWAKQTKYDYDAESKSLRQQPSKPAYF